MSEITETRDGHLVDLLIAAEAKVRQQAATIERLQHEIDLRVEQGKALNQDKDIFRVQVERLTQERDAAIAELNLWKADDSPSMVWQLRSTKQQVRELREALEMVWRMEGPNGNTYPAWVVEIADAALAAAKDGKETP